MLKKTTNRMWGKKTFLHPQITSTHFTERYLGCSVSSEYKKCVQMHLRDAGYLITWSKRKAHDCIHTWCSFMNANVHLTALKDCQVNFIVALSQYWNVELWYNTSKNISYSVAHLRPQRKFIPYRFLWNRATIWQQDTTFCELACRREQQNDCDKP